METLDHICETLGFNQLDKVKPVKDLSAKLGAKPGHLGLGVAGLLAVLIIFSYGLVWITFFVGFLYPAYKSFKALESKGEGDDKIWLTYWIVFGFLHVFDGLITRVLGFIPALGLIKIAFYVWLFHPKTLGSKIIYEKGFRPFLTKYQGQIDEKLNQINKTVEERSGALNDVAGNIKREALNRAVS